MKKISAFFLALVLTVCLFTLPISAEELSAETASDGSVLYNVQTQTFLVEKNADDEIFCGFLPRLVLAIMLTESKADLEEVIAVPSGTRAQTPQFSSADLKDGDKISLGDLISAMLIGNSQEASVAVALYMSDGNLSSIIAQMNEKAKTVGAENTVFTNVTGYNDRQNPAKTTLRDVVKICTYALTVDGILDRSEKSASSPNSSFAISPSSPPSSGASRTVSFRKPSKKSFSPSRTRRPFRTTN